MLIFVTLIIDLSGTGNTLICSHGLTLPASNSTEATSSLWPRPPYHKRGTGCKGCRCVETDICLFVKYALILQSDPSNLYGGWLLYSVHASARISVGVSGILVSCHKYMGNSN